LDFLPDFLGKKSVNKIFEHIYVIPESQILDSNIYIITNKNEYMLVDSGNGITFNQNLDAIRQIYKLENGDKFNLNFIRKIVQTHCHVDHILGLYKFLKRINPRPQVIASEIESIAIEKADKKIIVPIGGELIGGLVSKFSDIISGVGIHPIKVDIKLNDNEMLEFGDFNFKVLQTPGHTSGGICLYEEKYKILFSGDVVYPNGSFGNVEFPTGDRKKMVKSLKRLSKLDVDLLFPGHMMPVLKDGSKHIKLAYEMASKYL